MAQYITFQPSDYFNTKLYTGNGSTQNITGIGFDPDWIWCKSRALETHELYDKVRGATKRIRSDSTAAENTESYQSFITDGFSFSTGGNVNSNGVNFVSWNWKANGAGSTNTDGSTSSTVSANTTSGFSIVKYTNPGSGTPYTVGHGLGAAPKMIMTKRLDAIQTWGVWHTGIGFGKYLRLDSSAADASANLVTATSTTTYSTYWDHHDSGAEIIAYCFADVTGYQKIGSWTGTSNANGPMIYTGFKPAFVLSKNSDRNENWLIHDNKRGTINVNQTKLSPNDNSAESSNSAFALDFLSNGFKVRTTDTALNQSSEVYIYLAIAEHPLVSSNDIPGVAR